MLIMNLINVIVFIDILLLLLPIACYEYHQNLSGQNHGEMSVMNDWSMPTPHERSTVQIYKRYTCVPIMLCKHQSQSSAFNLQQRVTAFLMKATAFLMKTTAWALPHSTTYSSPNGSIFYPGTFLFTLDSTCFCESRDNCPSTKLMSTIKRRS